MLAFDKISVQVFIPFKGKGEILAELQFSQLADILTSAPQYWYRHILPNLHSIGERRLVSLGY